MTRPALGMVCPTCDQIVKPLCPICGDTGISSTTWDHTGETDGYCCCEAGRKRKAANEKEKA